MRTLLTVILVFIAGCTPNFEDVSLVKDLRVLGVQAEPPEILLPLGSTAFPPVHIQPLLVDPQAGPDALFEWQLWACTAEDVRCDADKVTSRRLVVEPRTTSLAEIQTDFVLDQELYTAALIADEAKGLDGVPVMLELRINRDRFWERAVKRVVYGNTLLPDKVANTNPQLDGVQRAGAEVLQPGQEFGAAPGEIVKLLPKPRANTAEPYWVATFKGKCSVDSDCMLFIPGAECKSGICARQLTEYLSYAFFTDAGALSDATTGGKPSPLIENKKIADPSSDWTAPPTPGTYRLWVVIRDDRGGMSWMPIQANVTQPSSDGGSKDAAP
jgi:hypothetical protein